MASTNGLPGLAFSGVFMGNPEGTGWVSDPLGDLVLAWSLGFRAISIPVWYPSDVTKQANAFNAVRTGASGTTVITLKEFIAKASSLGFKIHIAPHCYEVNPNLLWTDVGQAQMLAWIQSLVEAAGKFPPGTTFENFNEPINPTGTWSTTTALYTGVGWQIAQVVKQAGAMPIFAIPNDQSMTALKTMVNLGIPPITDTGIAVGWGAHLYKKQLTGEDPALTTWTDNFALLDAYKLFDKRQFIVTEGGGTNTSPTTQPDPVTYATIAQECYNRGITFYAWQARNPGDGLGVLGYSNISSAIVKAYSAPVVSQIPISNV